MRLLDADADNLRCTFVKDVYDTLIKRKYTTNYCWDDAKLSYTYYVASLYDVRNDTDCLLDEEFRCTLKEHSEDAVIVDCTAPVQYSCAEQATITLTQTANETAQYRAKVRNPYDTNSGFAYIQTNSNSTTLTAGINKYFERLDSGVWTGITGTSLSTNSTLSVKHIQYFTPIIKASSYIQSIRLGVYNAGVVTTFDIDVSASSSFLSVSGGYTVLTTDLTFNNAPLDTHWDTYNKVISNALRYVYGASFAAAFDMSLIVSSSGTAAISTVIKHNPTTYWAGIGISDFQMTFFDGVTIKVFSGKPGITLTQTPTWVNPTTTLSTGLCGSVSITMTNPYSVGAAIVNSSTDFKYVGLLSPNSTEAPPYTTSGTFSCESWTFTASFTNITPVQSYRWETTGGTILLADSLVYTTSTSGTYVFKVLLQNGCTVTKQITTSSAS